MTAGEGAPPGPREGCPAAPPLGRRPARVTSRDVARAAGVSQNTVSLEFPLYEIGRLAVRRLLRPGDAGPPAPVPARLVVCGST